MRGITGTIVLAWLATTASAGAVIHLREEGDRRPWVTIDASGTAATVTPTLEGGSAFTGSVAMPTAQPDGSGSFLVCNPQSGDLKFRPFCAPTNGAVVDPNTTYFITWEVDWFENPNRMAKIYAEFSTSDGFGGKEGFLTENLPVSNGYYAWTPSKSGLPETHNTTVQFYLEYDKTLKNETEIMVDRDPGTKVFVIRKDISPNALPSSSKSKGGSSGDKKVNVTAVAVGVVVGLVALGFAAVGVWWYGKRKGWFGAAKGYGARRSREQRAKGTANIKLQEGRWSDQGLPTSPGGQNVFREEIKRQEREG